jgi:hypothetical protein
MALDDDNICMLNLHNGTAYAYINAAAAGLSAFRCT